MEDDDDGGGGGGEYLGDLGATLEGLGERRSLRGDADDVGDAAFAFVVLDDEGEETARLLTRVLYFNFFEPRMVCRVEVCLNRRFRVKVRLCIDMMTSVDSASLDEYSTWFIGSRSSAKIDDSDSDSVLVELEESDEPSWDSLSDSLSVALSVSDSLSVSSEGSSLVECCFMVTKIEDEKLRNFEYFWRAWTFWSNSDLWVRLLIRFVTFFAKAFAGLSGI